MDKFKSFVNDNLPLVIVLAIVLVLVIAAIIILVVIKRKPKSKIKVDEDFINNLVSLLGNEGNINSVNVDNGRLKIAVNDLDLANLEGLKGISESGIFITGNTIKILFKLDSLTIKKALDKRL